MTRLTARTALAFLLIASSTAALTLDPHSPRRRIAAATNAEG